MRCFSTIRALVTGLNYGNGAWYLNSAPGQFLIQVGFGSGRPPYSHVSIPPISRVIANLINLLGPPASVLHLSPMTQGLWNLPCLWSILDLLRVNMWWPVRRIGVGISVSHSRNSIDQPVLTRDNAQYALSRCTVEPVCRSSNTQFEVRSDYLNNGAPLMK